MSDLIVKGAGEIKDGLYNIKDGKLFQYKANGGTVRTYPIVSADRPKWIPCSERLPIKEFKQGRKEGWVYDLYPCLVTRTASHSRENPNRTYVAKHYFNGEDFVNNGGDICNEVIAWMPLPEPYKESEE